MSRPSVQAPTVPASPAGGELAAFVAALPAAVALLEGPRHVFRAASAAYRAMVGGRAVVGLAARDALPELDAGFFDLLDRVYATGEEASGEAVAARWDADGDGVPEDHRMDFAYRPHRDADGVVRGIVAVVADVTARVCAEEALRRSEERYQLAARAASNAIWDWDLVAETIAWNEGIHTIFGHPPGSVPAGPRWWSDHIHPDDRERVVRGIRAVIDGAGGGHAWRDEYRFRRGDGSHADVTDRGYVARDAAGRAVRMVGAMADVSDARAARAAVERERADLEAVLDVVPIGIGIARDPACVDIRVNPAFAEQLGIALDVNASKSGEGADALPFRVLDPARGGVEVPPHELPMQRAARLGARVEPVEYDIAHDDGRVVRLLEYAVPLRDEAGRVRGAVGAFVDVTARARLEAAERAARESAEAAGRRLALLAEAGAALADSLDLDRTLRAVSGVALPALGDYCFVDLDEALWAAEHADAADAEGEGETRLRRRFLAHVDPARAAAAADAALHFTPSIRRDPDHLVVRAFLSGEPQLAQPLDAAGREALAIGPEHRAAIRALASTAALSVPLAARGRRLGVLTFCTAEPAAGGTGRQYDEDDVTLAVELARRAAVALDNARLYQEAERARCEAEAARRAAEGASRAKSDFLAVMSHELRTPLNSVLGHQEVLALGLHGPLTGAQADALERIRRSGTRLLALINDILSHARLEAGRTAPDLAPPPELVPVALGDALAEIEGYVAPQLQAKGIAYTLAPTDPGLAVLADRGRLQQILLNVVANAVKFTPSGGRIDVAADAGPEVVVVHVRDTGIGIPRDKLESVFQPFVQVDQRRTREHEGVGLGLAISRDLARAMDGDLTAESDVGAGATFTLRLRRAAGGG